MATLKLLRRHLGKLLASLFALWVFGYIDEAVECMGFTSERMASIQHAGGLAPFPRERSNQKVTHNTGMMHDTFSIYFTAKPDAVSRWMKDSPGIMETEPAVKEDGAKRYEFGQGRGFVFISSDLTEVGIVSGVTLDGPYASSPIPPRQY